MSMTTSARNIVHCPTLSVHCPVFLPACLKTPPSLRRWLVGATAKQLRIRYLRHQSFEMHLARCIVYTVDDVHTYPSACTIHENLGFICLYVSTIHTIFIYIIYLYTYIHIPGCDHKAMPRAAFLHDCTPDLLLYPAYECIFSHPTQSTLRSFQPMMHHVRKPYVIFCSSVLVFTHYHHSHTLVPPHDSAMSDIHILYTCFTHPSLLFGITHG